MGSNGMYRRRKHHCAYIFTSVYAYWCLRIEYGIDASGSRKRRKRSTTQLGNPLGNWEWSADPSSTLSNSATECRPALLEILGIMERSSTSTQKLRGRVRLTDPKTSWREDGHHRRVDMQMWRRTDVRTSSASGIQACANGVHRAGGRAVGIVENARERTPNEVLGKRRKRLEGFGIGTRFVGSDCRTQSPTSDQLNLTVLYKHTNVRRRLRNATKEFWNERLKNQNGARKWTVVKIKVNIFESIRNIGELSELRIA